MVFSVICLLSNNACNDKDVDCHVNGTCPEEYYKFYLGEAKNYLWAGKGSYWIYKNSKTGELDTQTVTYCKTYWLNVRGTQNSTRHINVDYEVLSRGIYSSFNQWVYEDRTGEVTPDGLYFNGTYRVILDRLVSGEGYIFAFDFPFRINAAIGNGSSTTWCRSADTSLKVKNIDYKGIKCYELDMDDIWYPNNHPISIRYPNAFYYWIKDIGLLKRYNKSENYSWDLIDYKINP